MNISAFKKSCETSVISRFDVEDKYSQNPLMPCSVSSDTYDEVARKRDALNFIDGIFGVDEELALSEISRRINEYKELWKSKKLQGPIWSTIRNIVAATAKAAADAMSRYGMLSEETLESDLEEIRTQGKPSPYGNMQFPTLTDASDTILGIDAEGEHHADFEAAFVMYDGNMLALLIARQCDIEQLMP